MYRPLLDTIYFPTEIKCKKTDIPNAEIVNTQKMEYSFGETVSYRCLSATTWSQATCDTNGWTPRPICEGKVNKIKDTRVLLQKDLNQIPCTIAKFGGHSGILTHLQSDNVASTCS